MTKTQAITHCEEHGCDEVAVERVTAQHFDPDGDDEGRAIGWSRPVITDLCQFHADEWDSDELVAIVQTEEL